MRHLLGGVAVAALTLATGTGAFAQSSMSHSSMMKMPACTSSTGPVVWYRSSTKTYYAKGSAMYGKAPGMYACKSSAAKMGGKMTSGMSSMSHGSMGSGAMSHGTTGGSGAMGGSSSGGSMGGSSSGGSMGGSSSGGSMGGSTSGGSMGGSSSGGSMGATSAPVAQPTANSGSMSGGSGEGGNAAPKPAGSSSAGTVPNNPAASPAPK